MSLSNGQRGGTAVPWLRMCAVVMVLLVLAIAAPLAVLALKTSLSLAALSLLALVVLLTLRALPTWLHGLELRLLRAKLATARAHPLEELQSQLLARGDELARYREALRTMQSQIAGMRELLETRWRADPRHDVSRQTNVLRRMVAFHASHVQKLADAEEALRAMRQHLAGKQFEWSFAQASQQALTSLSGVDGDALLQEMMHDEASHAVRQSFDRVFAELDVVALESTALATVEPS